MNTALIFDIKHFAIHDGDGIRTTVFFKGCPLKCVWCHNPEGISFSESIALYQHKCKGCGDCMRVCPEGAHVSFDGAHIIDFEKCKGCGLCTEECSADALKLYGRKVSTGEVLEELMEDKDFYSQSGGGVTLSGGECLAQADFCAELLRELKKCGIHTAVDTSGFVPRSAIDKVIPYTDVFLYDVKAFDESVHIYCTGRSNGVILENLKYIDACGKDIEIRIPYVPGYNDSEMEKIADFLSLLKSLKRVRLLSYHNYAGSKYAALGMENTLPARLPSEDEMEAAVRLFKDRGISVIR